MMSRRQFFSRAAAFAAAATITPAVIAAPRPNLISGVIEGQRIILHEPIRLFLDGPLTFRNCELVWGTIDPAYDCFIGWSDRDGPSANDLISERCLLQLYRCSGPRMLTILECTLIRADHAAVAFRSHSTT